MRRPAGAWSAKLWGNWRPGTCAEGQNPAPQVEALKGGASPERGCPWGLVDKAPREELVRWEERPRSRTGWRHPDESWERL